MKTKDLKYVLEMFLKISKPDPLRPVTSFVEMFCMDGVFRVGTTDGSTKLVATLLDTDDMANIVLERDQLLKLLKLTNKEEIKFIRKDKYVALKGCGNYKLPIQCDETGEQVKLNLRMPVMQNGVLYEIEPIKEVFSRNSVCLYDGDDYDFFKQYYCDNGKVFTTDIGKACTTNAILPQKLIPAKLMKQLACLDKPITFAKTEQGARVDCDIFQMYFMYDEPQEYPADMVRPFMGTDWSEFSFVLEKSELLGALKRIDLFTKPWQKGRCILTFDRDCVTILGENQDVNETISCTITGRPCRMVTSVSELLATLKKVEDNFTILGSHKCIGFQDSIGLYVLSLIDESEVV